MVEFELSVRMDDEVPIPDLAALRGSSPRMYRGVALTGLCILTLADVFAE